MQTADLGDRFGFGGLLAAVGSSETASDATGYDDAGTASATQQQAYRVSGYGWSTLGAAWLGGSLDYGHVTTQATRQVGIGSDLGLSRLTPSGDVVSGQVVLARPFIAADPLFTVNGAAPGRDALLAGVALLAQIGRASVFVSYGVSLAANDTLQTETAGLRVAW